MVFLLRYSIPLLGILLLLCVILSSLENILVSIFSLLALFVFLIGFNILEAKYRWVCKKCGYIDKSDQPEQYCISCGGIMDFKRIARYKICENGHGIKDKHDVYKFCPRCSKPLKEQIISKARKELSMVK